jgi:hypothetical protein
MRLIVLRVAFRELNERLADPVLRLMISWRLSRFRVTDWALGDPILVRAGGTTIGSGASDGVVDGLALLRS